MKKTLSLLILLFVVSPVAAILHRNTNEPGPVEYVRPVLDSARASSLGYSKSSLQQLIQTPTGTKKIAVIIVQFPSSGPNTMTTNTSYLLSATDLTNINATVTYLKNFYYNCSYGTLTLDPTFFYNGGNTKTLTTAATPFTLSRSMSSYGSYDLYGTGLSDLATDAINAAGSTVNYPTYDAVIVIHAGYGNESTNTTTYGGDIWSAVVELSTKVNQFSDAAIIPAREYYDATQEASTHGVICHEFGHVLGLPDLYNTSTGDTTVGKWCLMDSGSWNNKGQDPLHPSAWCKMQMQWISPVTISSSQLLSGITQFESAALAYKIPVLNNTNEYFLVCYSSKSAYNAVPPGEGFMIWHIDEGTIDNMTFTQRMTNNEINNYSHLTVDLVPAGPTHPSTYPYATIYDPWPGSKGTFTIPDSNSYDGTPSYISISNFALSASGASMYVIRISMADSVSISKAVNYPNPAGAGYPSVGANILTTFVFNFTRAPEKKTLSIYTIAGELVREIPGENISLIAQKSQDYKLVYEYNWDGRNSVSEPVAPGLYIYRLVADGSVKTGKFAVVR